MLRDAHITRYDVLNKCGRPLFTCEYVSNHEWTPELITADCRRRDETTGDMAIERVRDEVNMDVPAIIITGDTSPERRREATTSGFTLLHNKPLTGDQLITTVTGMMRERV